MPRRLLLAALLVAPAAALAVLAFDAGGYYPGTIGVTTVVALGALALWAVLAPDVLANIGRPAAVVIGLLAAFGGWTLLSGTWSHAPGRALVEFDRTLLYLAVFALFALAGRTGARVRVLVTLLAAATVVVAVAALLSYLLPDAVDVSVTFARRRLSYPTGYWNTTGLLAGLGVVWSLHLASGGDEHPVLRMAGAAAIVPLVAVLGYTASRGAVVATGVGVVVYVLATRSRHVVVGLIACAPPALAALVVVSHSPDLSAYAPLPPAAIAQGKHAATALVISAVAAAVLCGVLVALERRFARVSVPLPAVNRTTLVRAGAIALVAVVVLAVAAGLPGRISHAYEKFANGSADAMQGESHLASLSGDGRTELWHIAMKYGFSPDPLSGSGAGTFAVLWERYRQEPDDLLVASSLYIGTLGDLGLVGAALLFAALAMIAVGIARLARRRGAAGAAWAALLGAAAGWLVFAAVDWNWQVAACTIWLFAAGGLALSRDVGGGGLRPLGVRRRGRGGELSRGVAANVPGGGGGLRPLGVRRWGRGGGLSRGVAANVPAGGEAAGGEAAGGEAAGGEAAPARLGAGAAWAVRVAIAGAAVALALVPLAMARADRDLQSAIADLQNDNCPAAQAAAAASRDAISQRAEPYMVLAYCDARAGRSAAALSNAAAAVARDPQSWEVYYTQGLVQAAAGENPRAALHAALLRDPLGSYAVEASALLAHRSAAARRRIARRLPIPLADDECGGPTQAVAIAPCGNPTLPTLGAGPPVLTKRP